MTTARTVVATDPGQLSADERVIVAERRMYEAEIALHAAHQTRVDAWVAAAADRLHAAIYEHLTALRAADMAHRETVEPCRLFG